MPALAFQKQSVRNLVLSINAQAAYGGVMADAALTIRQNFDPSSVFKREATWLTDKMDSGKGTEFATFAEVTGWDTSGTLKEMADAQLMAWMLAFTFGQEVVVGSTAPYTHTFTIPPINATMPALATDDVNGWFESGTPLAISIVTNPALALQMGFNFPLAYVKANSLGNSDNKVMWQLQFDDPTRLQVGNQPAISAFVINNTPAYLVAV